MKPSHPPLGLFVLLSWILSVLPGQADERPVSLVHFNAPSVEREMPFNIILPVGYQESNKRYPVLYLLHGRGGDENYWVELGVPKHAVNYEMIVVMVSAKPSWFVNWVESHDGQKNDWEDYVIKDLIGYIDANYLTVASREGRAISGKSMGGFGALMLSFGNPELFCSTSSIAGGLRFLDKIRVYLGGKGSDPMFLVGKVPKRKQELAAATPRGVMVATLADCDAIDPFKLVLQIPPGQLPDIRIDCGIDDGGILASQKLATLLMEQQIKFTFSQAPGAHTSEYGAYAIEHTMAHQYAVMQEQLGRE